MNKADVYRKAAEVIGRDGWNQGGMFAGREGVTHRYEEAIQDQSLEVCAIGACIRAEFEMYGSLCEDPYEEYDFLVKRPDTGTLTEIWTMNDSPRTSAEDVILALKNHAEEIDK